MDKIASSLCWTILILIVICIAAFLIPQYKILSYDLTKSKALNVASALTTLVATNYTVRKTKHSQGIPIRNCKDIAKLTGANLPPGYEIENQPLAADDLTECNLINPRLTQPIKFRAIGIN